MTHRKMFMFASIISVILVAMTSLLFADTFTIGQNLENRASLDGAGNLFAVVSCGFESGTVTQWSIRSTTTAYSGTRSITPVIFEQTGAGGLGNLTIRGIGTTRALTHTNTVQAFDFGLDSGSAAMGVGYYFGWIDGTTGGATSEGVISFDSTNTCFSLCCGAVGTTSVGTEHSVVWNLDRRYSVQAIIEIDRGEAVGNGTSQRQEGESGSGGVFIQDAPFTQRGQVKEWALWSYTHNISITPLIFEKVNTDYILRGVGTSRLVTNYPGAITYDFGLQSGSDAVDTSYYFGWVDASIDPATGDPTNNTGVPWVNYSAEFSCDGRYMGGAYPAGTFVTNHNFGAGFSFDRTYSVQARSLFPPKGTVVAIQ